MLTAFKVYLANGDKIDWEFSFSVEGTIQIQSTMLNEIPEWVKLNYYQCQSCTLATENSPVCPVAEVLANYAYQLRNHDSTEKVNVEIFQDNQGTTLVNDIPLQTVVGELVRLAVFQYSCPVGRKVKSAMVELPPFPDNEKILQAFSIAFSDNKTAEDGNLKGDSLSYLTSLQDLFSNICHRLEDTGGGDANVNGVIMLHSLLTLFSLLSPEAEATDEYPA